MTIQKTEVVGATHGIRVTNEGVARDWMEIQRGEKAGEEGFQEMMTTRGNTNGEEREREEY